MSSFSTTINLASGLGREEEVRTDANGNRFKVVLDDWGSVCVTGALAFAPSAAPPVPGYGVTGLLTADGVHTPTFSGFTLARPSATWMPAAGSVNRLTFWCDPTRNLWYAFDTPMPNAPAFGGLAVVHGTNPTVELTIAGTELNTAIVQPARAFTVRDGNVALAVGAPTIASGTQVSVPLTGTVAEGDTLYVSYWPIAPNGLQDANGNFLALILDAPVVAS